MKGAVEMMEKALKQDEMDALLRAATQHQATAGGDATLKIQSYNFSRAGQISNEQMRAISLLNDMFARNLTHILR